MHHIYDSQGTIWYFPSLFIDPDNKVVSKNVTQDSVIAKINLAPKSTITIIVGNIKVRERKNQTNKIANKENSRG